MPVRPRLEPGEVFAGLSVWTKECYEQVLPLLPEHRRTETAVERDLPDAVEVVHGRGGKVSTFPVDAADALAPNEKDEFAEAADYMRRKVKYQLQDQGVVIPDFTQVRVDHTARVGKGTRLNSNTQVLGVTQIGERCTIGPEQRFETVSSKTVAKSDVAPLKAYPLRQDPRHPTGSRESTCISDGTTILSPRKPITPL